MTSEQKAELWEQCWSDARREFEWRHDRSPDAGELYDHTRRLFLQRRPPAPPSDDPESTTYVPSWARGGQS